MINEKEKKWEILMVMAQFLEIKCIYFEDMKIIHIFDYSIIQIALIKQHQLINACTSISCITTHPVIHKVKELYYQVGNYN